jgi:hypothetical protein
MESLNGTNWTAVTARASFPILVEWAALKTPITYSEWDATLIRRNLGEHVFLPQYGHPAGAIGDACEEYAVEFGIGVPPINLLVVNKKGIPGKGANYYIENYCLKVLKKKVHAAKLPLVQRRSITQQIHKEIFTFPSWNEVLK